VGSSLYSLYLAVHNVYGPNLIGSVAVLDDVFRAFSPIPTIFMYRQGVLDQSLQNTLMRLDKGLAKEVLLSGSMQDKESMNLACKHAGSCCLKRLNCCRS